MSEIKVSTPRAKGLDRLSLTFTKDQEFCEALAATQPWNVGRLIVYLRWAQNYMPPIQEELDALVWRHFAADKKNDASFWTLSLTGGILKDLALIPYLVVRGLIWDAGLAVRRSLESAGVLAHLWQDPSKVKYLSDPDASGFRNAFVTEVDRKRAADLKDQGIQKRFSVCALGKPMSDLYRLVSKYTIHGGSPNQLATSELEPTRLSCMLINRADPLEKDLARDLIILSQGCEMLCVEVAFVHGTFRKKYGLMTSKGGEGGSLLANIIDSEHEAEMMHLIQITLHDLGWTGKEEV